MTLTSVAYEFFDFEEPSPAEAQLGRQLQLRFANAPTLYVSWTWGRQHGPESQPYSVATGSRYPENFHGPKARTREVVARNSA